MYDTMPSFWKRITVEQRQELMNHINAMHKQVGDADIWTSRTGLLKFADVMPLKHVPTLQICYQVAKNNPDVLTMPHKKNVKQDPHIEKQQQAAAVPLQSFMLLPPNVLLATKNAVTAAEKLTANFQLFTHAAQFCNRTSFIVQKQEVSEYPDLDITKEQQQLLNPTVLDTVTGFIIKDSQGKRAKKRLPQRRLNMIDAIVLSHCCISNSDERLELVKQSNEVAAIIGDTKLDRLKLKEASKRRKMVKTLQKLHGRNSTKKRNVIKINYHVRFAKQQ